MDIVVVGSCVQDLISYTPRFPNPGESVRGRDFHAGSGGKGANQAVAAAKLGAKVAMVGRVGNDIFGPENKNNMKQVGVNVDHVTVSETAKTATATITVSDSGENMIVVVLGANMEMSPASADEAESLIAQAKVLCCQLEIPEEASLRAMQIARKHHVKTIFNPAPGLPNLDKSMLQYADIVCPNENEAEMLTGIHLTSIDDAKQAALKLITYGPSIAIVTLGGQGAVVVSKSDQEPVHVAAPSVKATDTTGAGDCFVGALAFLLVTQPHLDIKEQVRRAVSIASISVQRNGTQTSYPLSSEVDPSLL
uniref:Ribokinase n=1 Tax=Plectus sambesii TaxID=2011161 RepID=A0A914X7N4_9BILA